MGAVYEARGREAKTATASIVEANQRLVAAHGREMAEDIEVSHRQEDGDGVVVAGVAIDDDPLRGDGMVLLHTLVGARVEIHDLVGHIVHVACLLERE